MVKKIMMLENDVHSIDNEKKKKLGLDGFYGQRIGI